MFVLSVAGVWVYRATVPATGSIGNNSLYAVAYGGELVQVNHGSADLFSHTSGFLFSTLPGARARRPEQGWSAEEVRQVDPK